MNWTDWIFIALLVGVAILIFIALKFPDPKKDWPFNVKNTAILLGSCLVFVVLFTLMNFVKNSMDWPSQGVVLFWAMFGCFVILVVVGVFLPHGIRLKSTKDEE